jgi:catechol 2,3-dioxygenase-like lactoylglutathione lyase family enzyme
MIQSIDHVQITIPKGQEEQAREFYCGLLGLQELEKPAELKGRGGIWLSAGGMQMHIGTEDGVDRLKTKAHVAFLVSDAQEWRRKFHLRGVEILEGIPIPGCDRFEFRDPFGNRVELIQRGV